MSRSDVIALFICVREDAYPFPMVRDIGDAIAHAKRDRGHTFDYLDDMVEQVISALRHGGSFQIDVLLEVTTVVKQLAALADRASIDCDRAAMLAHVGALVPVLADVLHGTIIDLQRTDVRVTLIGAPIPHVRLDLLEPIPERNSPVDVPFAFPLLEERYASSPTSH